jgi:hypothetical protein
LDHVVFEPAFLPNLRLRERKDLSTKRPKLIWGDIEARADWHHFVGINEYGDFALVINRDEATALVAFLFAVIVEPYLVTMYVHHQRIVQLPRWHEDRGRKTRSGLDIVRHHALKHRLEFVLCSTGNGEQHIQE